jgi:DNA invertase Pin-like site-specific DNA recombinase
MAKKNDDLMKEYRKLHGKFVKAGLKRAVAKGVKLGRPPLADDKADAIRAARAEGKSLRAIADECDVGLGTVVKLVGKGAAQSAASR